MSEPCTWHLWALMVAVVIITALTLELIDRR